MMLHYAYKSLNLILHEKKYCNYVGAHIVRRSAAGPAYRCLSKSGKQTFETSDVHVFALGVQPSIGWRFNSHWDLRLTNRWDFDAFFLKSVPCVEDYETYYS